MLTGLQSALSPAGTEGEAVAEMVWVLAAGAAAVLLVVGSLAAAAVFGRQRISARGERMLLLGGGILFPLVTLTALLVYSLMRGEAMRAPLEPGALRIEVTAEQWWWRAGYFDAQGALQFETANEIRIPAGRPVVLELKSADVIHSFWVPALAGKLDMIPGRTNRLRLLASRTGEFRGQCAEYCGGPHALMAFFVVAEEQASFEAWRENQQAPARRSDSLFVERCGACHTVRGTPAVGKLGPDLTHVASRRTIGAALLPRNEGTLAAWIASSQHLKPGNLMPSFASLEASELRDLVRYLGTLE